MKKGMKAFALAGLGAVISSTTLAMNENIKDLPDGGIITISGTIERIRNNHEFTLRDNTGVITVEVGPSQSMKLQEGAVATVAGTVEKGLLSTNLSASSINLEQAPKTKKCLKSSYLNCEQRSRNAAVFCEKDVIGAASSCCGHAFSYDTIFMAKCCDDGGREVAMSLAGADEEDFHQRRKFK